MHLTLPAKPREGELSDAELAGVAGGWSTMAMFSQVRWQSLSTEDKYKEHQAYPSLSPSQKESYNSGNGMPPS